MTIIVVPLLKQSINNIYEDAKDMCVKAARASKVGLNPNAKQLVINARQIGKNQLLQAQFKAKLLAGLSLNEPTETLKESFNINKDTPNSSQFTIEIYLPVDPTKSPSIKIQLQTGRIYTCHKIKYIAKYDRFKGCGKQWDGVFRAAIAYMLSGEALPDYITVYQPITGTFTKFAMPLMRKSYPSIIAQSIVNVQPMATPASLIYYVKSRYLKKSK